MRKHLIEFIRAVQEQAREGHENQLRTHIVLGNNRASGELWFGYGHFQRDKVLWWASESFAGEEMTVEEGVNRFLTAYGLEK